MLRSLAEAMQGLILTCTISILAVANPVLAASQEREPHLQKAIGQLLDGQPLPAITDASAAVKVHPQSAEALAILGLCQLRCGEWEKAESRLTEALAIDSLSPEAHLGLGAIAASKMRYRDAIPHLRKATSSRVLRGEAYRALAWSLEDSNLHQEASQAMQEASTYSNDLRADELVNLRAWAAIFAAHDHRSLYRISTTFKSTSIPFDPSGSHITFPVVLNGSKQVDCVLDTGNGGTLMISDDYAEGLELTYLGEITAISLNGRLRLKAAILDSVRMGGLEMRDVPVLVCEDSPFGSIGVIGWKLIQRVNTTVDFNRLVVELSSQDSREPNSMGVRDEKQAECVPFVYMTSMYIVARFGGGVPRAFILDTGADASYLHFSDSDGRGHEPTGEACPIRIGDLTFDVPQTQFIDFSAIHKKGRYYFAGVIGNDVLRQGILQILPREGMLCIERGAP